MRFIFMIALMLSAFFVASRLQVNEHATFITKSGEVLEGTVRREFVSGDYRIELASGETRQVSFDDFGGMAFTGSAVPWYAGALGFLLIGLGACVGFGVDRRVFRRRA